MELKVFTTAYHISVNSTLFNDIIATGAELILPDSKWGKIDFFAPNEYYIDRNTPGVRFVSHQDFLNMPPMAIIIPCNQLYDDMIRLYEERGRKDTIVYLTALPDCVDCYKEPSDYVISHDLTYHRACKAKYKILYFSKPTIKVERNKDMRKAYDERKIKLYINNFLDDRFELERRKVHEFGKSWLDVSWYGWGVRSDVGDNGRLSMEETQENIKDSMFTLVFKRPETWGQLINESMLLGTPCIFLREFMSYGAFRRDDGYMITQDNAIIGDTVEELIEKINSLTFEQYETLCFEAQKISEMFCEDKNRQEKLKWLFEKINI